MVRQLTKGGTAMEYRFTVNYDLAVEDALKIGQYKWIDSNITSERFPTKREGVAEVAIELVHLDQLIAPGRAREELIMMNYYLVELRELIAFSAKYPNVQREFPIVALRSGCIGAYNDSYFPLLSAHKGIFVLKRGLYLCHTICKNYRLAAIRRM